MRWTCAFATACWRVLCDPNQLESALLNLAINARDAMPDGGSFTIATADRSLSRDDLSDQNEAKPGAYVEIAVTDTGTGMTADVWHARLSHFRPSRPARDRTGLVAGVRLRASIGWISKAGE